METIAVSIAEEDGGEIYYYGKISSTPEVIKKVP